MSLKIEEHHEIVETLLGGISDAMEDECFWTVDQLMDRLHQIVIHYEIVCPPLAESYLPTWQAAEATLAKEYTDQMLRYRSNSGLWIRDDGGRKAAGHYGKVMDCVVRAISIAMKKPYSDVWNFFEAVSERNPDEGVDEHHVWDYIQNEGWTRKHFGPAEAKVIDIIPNDGPALVWCGFLRDLHCTAAMDGVVRDDWNPLGLEVIWIATPTRS